MSGGWKRAKRAGDVRSTEELGLADFVLDTSAI